MKQATLVLALVALMGFPACNDTDRDTDPSTTTLKSIGAELRVEIRSTDEGRQRGLMHRTELGENEGMLFVYPQKQDLQFWMMNTPLPLSIAFLDDDGKVVNIEDMAPADPKPRYRSRHPVRYALEVNQGWFLKNGIAPGEVFHFELPAGLLIR